MATSITAEASAKTHPHTHPHTQPAPVPTTPVPTTPVPTTPVPTTPAPTTPAAGSASGYNGFGASAMPGADWQPYAASSPFNQLANTSPVHASSAAIVSRVLSWSLPGNLTAGNSGTTSDYGHPTYYSQPTDPIFTLHATGTQNSIEGMRIPVPNAARPAAGNDGHMTIVTPDGWEYDLWRVSSKPQGGGTLTFSIGGRIRVDGSGLDGKATAANFGNLAGIIRGPELAAGHIDHALFIVVKCTSTKTTFGYGTKAASGSSAYVYPASHSAARCSSADDVNAPPVGARFSLAMTDAQIAALQVPAYKKTILTALAHYGGYVGDTGGPGFAFQFESGSTYTSFGSSDPLVDYAKANRVPTYNGQYVFNMSNGVDWARYLRVETPPPVL